MPDPLRDLIRDTLSYLKNPLLPRRSHFASPENCAFFQKNKELVTTQNIQAATQPQSFKEKTTSAQPKTPPTREPLADKLSDSAPAAHSPIQKTLQRIAPSLKLLDQIPDDRGATRISNAWKEKIIDADVILLVCDSRSETLDFLKTLAKAIDQRLTKVKILMAEKLEREKRWDLFFEKNSLRLIISSDTIQRLPELMRFYKALPAQAQIFLDQTPLLVLSPVSTYRSLEHKALLWKTLCHMLKK